MGELICAIYLHDFEQSLFSRVVVYGLYTCMHICTVMNNVKMNVHVNICTYACAM